MLQSNTLTMHSYKACWFTNKHSAINLFHITVPTIQPVDKTFMAIYILLNDNFLFFCKQDT